MKLVDQVTLAELNLPNDLLWTDEFNWSPVVIAKSYTLSGSLVLESGKKLAGRPISLSAPADMGWVTRTTIQTVRDWAAIQDRQFKLIFEYPTDSRQFLVRFDQENDPIQSSPVKGFPSHNPGDWYNLAIKLIEVTP